MRTTNDLALLLCQYFHGIGLNTPKLWSFVIDGAEFSLDQHLADKYNNNAFVIWGLSHAYNLIFKQSFYGNEYFEKNNFVFY